MAKKTKSEVKRDPATGRMLPGHEKVGGRVKGTPNRLTTREKELLATLVEHGLELAVKDYNKLRRKLPGEALRVLAKFTEYRLPKLARVEQTGPDGGPVIVERVVHIVNKDKE